MKGLLHIMLWVLAGYYYFGKAWAYSFIGELFLFGTTAILMAIVLFRMRIRRGVSFILYLLMGYALYILLVNLPRYGFSAIRDSMTVFYAFYGLFTYHAFLYLSVDSKDWLARVTNVLSYLPFFYLLIIAFPSLSALNPKVGGMAAHTFFLMGALIIGLWDIRDKPILRVITLISFVGILGFEAAYHRGGTLGLVVAFVLFFFFKRKWVYFRYAFIVGVLLISFLAVLNNLNLRQDGNFQGRTLSVEQIVSNFGSIVETLGEVDVSGLKSQTHEGGKTESANILWRLIWWAKITDYTIFGNYFWTGKGFGVNLGADDGMTPAEMNVRSPHNIFFSYLARLGVIGLCLWISYLIWLSLKTIYYLKKLRLIGLNKHRDTLILTYCTWMSFLVIGFFDVFLEGPMAAIPFWVLNGVIWHQFYESKQLIIQVEQGTLKV